MTPEQAETWFTYHAPTDETAPKYGAIREAEQAAAAAVRLGTDPNCPEPTHVCYGNVNAACRAFAVVIDAHCPDGYDKDAAIRAVRLARNAANEAIAIGDPGRLCAIALTKLQEARWQANGAIACGGL